MAGLSRMDGAVFPVAPGVVGFKRRGGGDEVDVPADDAAAAAIELNWASVLTTWAKPQRAWLMRDCRSRRPCS